MSLIFLSSATALMQPSNEPPVPAPTAPPRQDHAANPVPQMRLPFETGQLVFSFRAWVGGETRCDARGHGANFEAAAAEFCSLTSIISQEEPTEGDPFVEFTNVITVARANDSPMPLPDAGQRRSDTEAEVEVLPDGSVIACRLLHGERSDGPAYELQPDDFCRDMLSSAPSFQAWTGEGPRQGRVRLTTFISWMRPSTSYQEP